MNALESSFRDPAGFVFEQDGIIYRAINSNYADVFQYFTDSGLYTFLTQKKLLISHEEVNFIPLTGKVAKIIKPQQLPFVSYAYEWSFSMLRDAALCTLDNAIEALSFDMVLKDANTFNIQFVEGAPILIDTLSFESYRETESWVAYRQFCECFLAPLLLMRYCDTSLHKLLLIYPDGIPLDLCVSLLPAKAKFNIHVYLHIFLQHKLASRNRPQGKGQVFSRKKMLTLLNGLKSFVLSLHHPKSGSEWDRYYDETILSKDYLYEKKELVSQFLKELKVGTLLDLGANNGEFSLLAKVTCQQIISVDQDENCIEELYQNCRKNGIKKIIPLLLDIANPNPAIGWANLERESFLDRAKPDLTLVLALIHHLVLSKNLNFKKVMELLFRLSEFVIIEFIDHTDPKVKILVQNRQDILADYTRDNFLSCVEEQFEILKEHTFKEASRSIYLLKRKTR